MRQRYLVCYDIADPKRLRAVFKKMNGFGDPLQYSVYTCDLSDAEKALLRGALCELMNLAADRVMFVRLGPLDGAALEEVEFLGAPRTPWKPPQALVV